jgi:hypothetical protein
MVASLVFVERAAMANCRMIDGKKEDIDALRLMKVGVLGRGMLPHAPRLRSAARLQHVSNLRPSLQ